MAVVVDKLNIDELSVAERIELIGELWDSLGDDAPIPEWHHAVLRDRIRTADADPDAFKPWEEVRAQLLNRF